MNESVKEVSSSNDILVEVTLANICHLLARAIAREKERERKRKKEKKGLLSLDLKQLLSYFWTKKDTFLGPRSGCECGAKELLNSGAVVVSQLVGWLLPIPQVCGSNPVIGKKLNSTFTVN